MEKLHKILTLNYLAHRSKAPRLIQKGIDNDIYSFVTQTGRKKIARINRREGVKYICREIELIEKMKLAGRTVFVALNKFISSGKKQKEDIINHISEEYVSKQINLLSCRPSTFCKSTNSRKMK